MSNPAGGSLDRAWKGMLAAIALVVAVRAWSLSKPVLRLDAHGERAWFAWACPDPSVRARIAAAAAGLAPGRSLWVDVAAPRLDPHWVFVMALYELPRTAVVGGARLGSGPTARSRMARIVIGPPAPPGIAASAR